MLIAAALAALTTFIETRLPQTETMVAAVAGVFFVLLAATVAGYSLVRRDSADPAELALVAFGAAAILLLSVYFFRLSSYLLFPADLLIWSESDFVNDIVKLREGYPLYTAAMNNESQVYTPGAQLLTYAIAALVGQGGSVPAFRVIQLVYVAVAVLLGIGCWRRLMRLSGEDSPRPGPLWIITVTTVFILVATNMLTNPFVHHIHNDALALMVSLAAYWLLLAYAGNRDPRWLWVMALVPAVGFLVKQSMAIWAVLYCVHLAIFDRPRSWRRLAAFAGAAFLAVGAAVGVCFLIWNDPFIYWVFGVLGTRPVSPLRSFQHLLDVWAYVAIGLLGGAALLRGPGLGRLVGPFVVWILLLGATTYTSGAAWTRSHIGPASLIAAVWFIAALAGRWASLFAATSEGRAEPWLRGAIVVPVLILMFNGLGAFRVPTRPLPRDAYRYVREIESEFVGYSAEDVLLDVGSWIYLRHGVVMKDRATSIGDRGYAGSGEFASMLRRIRDQRYAKILVRGLHSPDFWYDHHLWPESSGVREALLENYREVGRIAPVVYSGSDQAVAYLFSEISVLIPQIAPEPIDPGP